jgi:hypothetical protein
MDANDNNEKVDDWLPQPFCRESVNDKKVRKEKEKQIKYDKKIKASENVGENMKKNTLEKKRIDPVVKEATAIFSDYTQRMRGDVQFQNLSGQSRFEYYMKKYIDFARQYPIILRHIACFGMHSEKAIRLYMKKCFNIQTDTDETFCERQADFVKFLYMYSGKHCSQCKLNAVWAHTKKHLMDELEANKKEMHVIKDRREKNKENNNIERRDNVKRILKLRQQNDTSIQIKKTD